jgi:hypothetical protein
LSTPAPPGWGSLTHELRILDAVNVYWLVLSVRHGQVAARPARTREDQVAADATWIDTLVDIAHLPGPYRAQVAAGYTRNGAVVAHFSHRVTALIAADTARFNRRHESDRAETIRVDGDTVHVVHRTASGDEVAEPVTPDESGRFVIGAGTWDWQIWPWTQLVTDANHGRAHPGAVEDCGCPSFCALCRTPLRHSHDFYCPWTDGSHPWEQPNIPAVEIVAPAHTHQPGCPQMQRQPGRLFQQIDSDGSVQCGFCAAVNTMDVEVVDSFGGTTESHERCTHCGESWSFIDMTPVL